MKGADIAKILLPMKMGPRDSKVLELVRAGHVAPLEFYPVWTSFGPYVGTLYVTADAVRLGDSSDSFRMSVGQQAAQRIADAWGFHLPTEKISDETWAQAPVRLKPKTREWWKDKSMSRTSRIIEQSRDIDELVGGRAGIIADVGKDWVNSRTNRKTCQKPECSRNYGWHYPGPGDGRSPAATPAGGYVLQTLGTRHGMFHSDYSQYIRLVAPMMTVCGPGLGQECVEMSTEKVAMSPQLYGLVAHDGPTPLRHPGVKKDSGIFAKAANVKYFDAAPRDPSGHPSVFSSGAGISPAPLAAGAAGALVGFFAARKLTQIF